MKFLMISLVFILFIFLISKQPMMMLFSMVLLTINFSILIKLNSNMIWYSYMMFLMMVSGLLIAFSYISSLSSNEYITYSRINMTMFILMISLMIFFMLMNFHNYSYINMNWNVSAPSYYLMIYYSLYLTLILISIWLTTSISKGPLKIK